MTDTIVVGGGLAGLAAAIRLADKGQSVTLMSFGLGGLQLGQGTIDVLGYDPDLVKEPFAQLASFVKTHPGHPYSHFTPEEVQSCVDWLAEILPDLLVPGDGHNKCVPTALGAMRPTYLVQPSMQIPVGATSLAVVGPHQLKDFYPKLCAENLEKTSALKTTSYHIDLPARPGEVDSSGTNYASALDTDDYVKQFAQAVKKAIGGEDAVGLPAVLGRTTMAYSTISSLIGKPVVEIMLAPPGIPGMRLNEAMTALAKAKGARMILGSRVVRFETAGGHVTAAVLHQAGYDKTYSADHFVYAPGGFETGALSMDSYGKITENVLGLPLRGADSPDLITGDYWADQGLFAVGVDVDEKMRPTDLGGVVIYDNLHTVGGILAGAIRWTQKSGDGIAVASAARAADAILEEE